MFKQAFLGRHKRAFADEKGKARFNSALGGLQRLVRMLMLMLNEAHLMSE